jgi:hypothetical protein
MLASFDDHMLADIGITRADLQDVLAEPCWCDPATPLNLRRRERILASVPQLMAERRAEEMDVQAGHHVFELGEEPGCGCGADAQSANQNEHRQQ